MHLTKFLPPKPTTILGRERLISRLRAWEDKKLVIIHAQAGQGKSTLAADYISTLPGPSVWYNIDQEDDNPAVFLSCLGQAIQQTFPEHVANIPHIPQNRYSMSVSQAAASRWVAQVFAHLPQQTLIIFDDFNNIGKPATINNLLRILIDATPPRVRFMLISRTQPELEIARLHAKRGVGEIAGDDLKFSDTEVSELFITVFGMHLAQNEVDLINRTAEGWAAGLVLMHEYLASQDPNSRSLSIAGHRQAGFQNYVFDYLAQEVFSKLPKEMQDFLLRTSIADYLPTPLMGLLTNLPTTAGRARVTTQTMVNRLRKKNLFVAVADDGATVVRYHALFREFIRKKLLAQTKHGEIKKLYSTAARFFKKSGDPVRAVNLYLESGQFDKAVEQIEASGQELIARGQTQTLLRWIEALPLDYVDRPWFLFYRAVACRFTDPRRALTLFDRALSGFRSNGRMHLSIIGQMLSLGGIIEACFYSGDNFKRMDRAAARATALLKQNKRETSAARSRLLLTYGMACFFVGKLSQGVEALQQALELFRKSGDHFYQINSAIYLAPCAIYYADFRLAREAVRKGCDALKAIPEEKGGEAALFMAEAMTALYEGNFAEAQECIDTCHSLANEHDLEAFHFLSLDIGGWLKIATGDYASAERLLLECKQKGEERKSAFFNTSAAHLLAVNYLHQGRLEEAKQECDYALRGRAQLGSKLFYAVSLSASGAIRLKLNKLAQAERDLLHAAKIFNQIGAGQQLANVHLVLAKLYGKSKKVQEARRHVRSGFQAGKDRGFTYYYLLNHADIEELAKAAIEDGTCVDYCESLIKDHVRKASSPRIRVHCLGGFNVYRGEKMIQDTEWKSKRAKSLLKFLTTHDGQKVPRDVVIETLWPDHKAESIRPVFSSLLYRIRRLLEPDAVPSKDDSCILQDGNLLALNRDRVWTDVGAFLALLETAARMKRNGDPKKIVGIYEKAFSYYQGDFLPEELYDDWVGSVRDHLRTAYLKALEEAGTICDCDSAKSKAAFFYQNLFFADPCHEKACRWLMAWQHANGQRGEAIRTYERCQMALDRELAVEPDVKTTAVYRNVIAG